jgi:BirA family transcriptional regulator, biotin operon repressor / biotin---[acetyl-CoA-carboxylase] ligase
MQLDPSAAAAGVRVVHHKTVGSTNSEALGLARNGECGPLWITARTQTAGRGRRGRSWVSEPGNLYASLLLTDPAPPDRAAELSLVAALAVHDAIGARTPGVSRRLTLKWPNDVLIDGNKFAGILIEGEGVAVVIGIGVNCVHHPSGTAFPATDLATAGVRAPSETVFGMLSAAMLQRLALWNRGADFAAIRADWLARAGGLGKPISVVTAEGAVEGRFEGIDERGHLVVRLVDGNSRTVVAGDVTMAARR